MVSGNLPFEYFFLGNVRFSGDVVANVGARPVREIAIDRRVAGTALLGRPEETVVDVSMWRRCSSRSGSLHPILSIRGLMVPTDFSPMSTANAAGAIRAQTGGSAPWRPASPFDPLRPCRC